MHPASASPQSRGRKPRIELASEPFRLLFPAGLFVGVLGVALWPLFLTEWLPFYPGAAHARLMIGGFFGAMMIGFLGTAGPRMLSASHLHRFEFGTLFLVWLAAVMAALFNRLAWADGLTCVAFIVGFRCAAVRFGERKDLPPPGFALVVLGMACGFVGSMLNFAISLRVDWLPDPIACNALAKLLFYQGFILLPVLGVAPFFFPRFGTLANPKKAIPAIQQPSSSWARRALIATAFGFALIITFVIEAHGGIRAAGIARAAMVSGFVVWQVPLGYKSGQVGTLGRVVQLAVGLLILGLLLPALFPASRIGLLHFLFIGGFNLITLAVASWVIFGHSGAVARGRAKLPALRLAVGLILFALATRVVAEFIPAIRESHLNYAAISWIIGIVIWAWHVMPRVVKSGGH